MRDRARGRAASGMALPARGPGEVTGEGSAVSRLSAGQPADPTRPAPTRTHGQQLRLLATVVSAWALAAVAGAPAGGSLAAGACEPRSSDQITRILAAGPHAGDCERCHTEHGSGQTPQLYALVGPDDNALCDRCHTGSWTTASYPGTWTYAGSAHGSSPSTIWPGLTPPARVEANAAGKCVNCHDPHGWQDDSGEITHLGVAREEAACLTCHDGSPATTNVRAEFLKPFRHPTTDFSGRHTGPEESSASDFGTSPLNRRHAECEDCHNPHVARSDPPLGHPAPSPSLTVLGVSRVLVENGPAGAAPAYTFVAGSDTMSGPPEEYQLCMKCHSSWTTQPPGQTDLGRALNPANPSYHPVEAIGANPNIQPDAFAAGWSALSRTGCGDCHGSDFESVAGPHGSAYRYILRSPYTASPAPRAMAPGEACFSCHAYDVYANSSSSDAVLGASRFNRPGAVKGHVEHVGQLSVPCYSCHATHGSTDLEFLLVRGRWPGITAYTKTPTGGTCTATCHGAKSYTANYAR